MAKKSRRGRRKQRAPRMYPKGAPTSSTIKVEEAPTAVEQRKPRLAPASATDLREEYAYVREDLKRIAILAGSILAVLIVLALILP